MEYVIVPIIAVTMLAAKFLAMVAAVLVGLWVWDRWQGSQPSIRMRENGNGGRRASLHSS